jgi:hypothetical protein
MAQEQPTVQFRLSSYAEGKANGTVKIVKLNGVAHVTQKIYDQNTGAARPLLVPVELKQFEQMRATMAKELEVLDALIADIQAAPEKLA